MAADFNFSNIRLGFLDQDFMGADGSENHFAVFELKGKTIFHGDRTFPQLFGSLDALDPKGRMKHIPKQ